MIFNNMLSTKWHQSEMWLTSCCHAVTWNAETFFPFCLSVSSLELGCKQKNRAGGLEKIFVLLSRFFTRWTLECPSPMCFSTTAPEPSSPSEPRICMVVPCAPRSCVVPNTLHCCLTSSAFCFCVRGVALAVWCQKASERIGCKLFSH